MERTENPSVWDKIQRNVQETERLMGQKKYNLSMIKARQTMEYMVKLQCDKAGIVEGNTETMIRELYGGKWISKATAEHYLQILSIGDKASKENDNSAYNANQAYHALSQEIYVFKDMDRAPRARRAARPAVQTRQPSRQQPVRSRKKQAKGGLNSSDLLKLLIPVALIVVLIIIIQVMTPGDSPTDETTTAAPTTEATTEAPTTEAPTTEAPTEEAAVPVYRTTDTLNVRSGPSTDSDRIGKLDPGVTVNYLRAYDDEWAVIQYNDQEAYVASQYLAVEEP